MPRPLPTDKFWLIAEPAISAQVVGTADSILVENTPSFLDSIRLTTFTMGTKGPRIEGVKSYPKTDPNVVVSNFLFIPSPISSILLMKWIRPWTGRFHLPLTISWT
jgi:Ca2+-dependent lipid-binding protein